MVAYSFQARFELPILSRNKNGTIRAPGKKRHARPGEEIQLYYGLRTKRCRLIARARCAANTQIKISFEHEVVLIGEYPNTKRIVAMDERTLKILDAFACCDGFENFADMRAFWNVPTFEGRWIQWHTDSLREAV